MDITECKSESDTDVESKVDLNLDSIVISVINKFKRRARMGKEKYGTDLDRQDLSVNDWIEHAQDELMDGILYLQKLKESLKS